MGVLCELKIYLDCGFALIAFQCYYDMYLWALGAKLLYFLAHSMISMDCWFAFARERDGDTLLACGQLRTLGPQGEAE